MSIKTEFIDLIDKAEQVKENNISKEDFREWLDENLEIETYLPISKKYAMIQMFYSDFEEAIEDSIDSDDTSYICLMYDIKQLFNFLPAYINMTVLPMYGTIDNYDLIMSSGLFDYVMEYCGNDYMELIAKCDRVVNIDNISLIRIILKNLNPFSVEDAEKVRDILNREVDLNKLEVLSMIEGYNNPLLKEVVEGISRGTVKEVMRNKEDG